MSGLADRVRLPRNPLPRRARPVRPLDVDGRPSPVARLYGLGTVFGKSLRDSRGGMLYGGLGIALLVFFTASQVAAEFGTEAARAAMANLPNELPVIFRGLLGEPINVGTLGGFLSWRTLNIVPLILGAWSIVALSGSLVAEARRGSLDLVLATPRDRLSVALQKAAAHVVAMGVAALLIGVGTWLAGSAFQTLPGDEIGLGAALAHGIWLGAMAIVPGSIAWLLAPIAGRGAAAGVAAVVMVGSFVATGYREAMPLFESVDAVSFFGWTAGHRPIAGAWDWTSLAAVTAIACVLFVAGAMLFRTRDVGVSGGLAIPLPRLRLGLGGPFGRSFAERLTASTWWGLGLGSMGFIYAANADAFIEALSSVPQMREMVERFFPGVDIFSAGGILQLVFFGFGSLLVAAVAGTLVSGWASDESDRRLELLLAAPIGRARWAVLSGAGVIAAVAWFTLITAALVALGTIVVGDDPANPILGAVVLGLYGAALVGIGLAVAGLLRPGLGATVAGGLGVTFYLIDTLGAALNLPDAVLDLSLTRHLGQPMAGVVDGAGIVACVALAVGGIVVGAMGLRSRDVGR
jgi:ABC-2 type transport system permease protein